MCGCSLRESLEKLAVLVDDLMDAPLELRNLAAPLDGLLERLLHRLVDAGALGPGEGRRVGSEFVVETHSQFFDMTSRYYDVMG